MQRMGMCLIEELKSLKGFETIEYFPHGEYHEPGAMAPDMCVTLDLDQIEQSGLTSRKLEAKILMVASNTLTQCRAFHNEGLGPPRIELTFDATLDHRSTTTGIGSPSSRYKLAAENIGEQLGAALAKKLNELYDKDGPLPELPEAFYPAYREPPAIPLPEGESAKMITSYRGLMTANETLWRLETDRNMAEVLTDLKVRLDAEGWRVGNLELRDSHLPHMRAFKDDNILTAYPQRKRKVSSPGLTITMDDAVATETVPEPTIIMIHYLGRMNREQVAAALDGLIDSDAPTANLVIFEGLIRGDQRKRLLERFEERPPTRPGEWLVASRMYKNEGQDDKSREALVRAIVLLRTVGDTSGLKSRIDDLAKKHGVKDLSNAEPEPALLKKLGFIEITPKAEIPARELGLDEPAMFYGRTDEGKIETITIRMVQRTTDKGEREYAISFVGVAGDHGGRTWGTGGNSHHTEIDGACKITFQIEKIADGPQFRLTTDIMAIP